MQNQTTTISKLWTTGTRALLAVVATLAVALVAQSSAHAGPPTEAQLGVNTFHAYHNSLAGVVIASPACGTEVLNKDTNETGLDIIDDALDVSTKSGRFWVYDGLRTLRVSPLPLFGNYDFFEVEDSECYLYTNSATAKTLLNDVARLSRHNNYDAVLFSLPRFVD